MTKCHEQAALEALRVFVREATPANLRILLDAGVAMIEQEEASETPKPRTLVELHQAGELGERNEDGYISAG